MADLALSNLMESWCARPSVMAAYGITFYYRFKDDMIFSGSDAHKTRCYFSTMRAKARYYVMTMEVVGRSIKYLDLRLTVGEDGRVSSSAELKSTTMAVPLRPSSRHPPGSHTWAR